VLFRAGMFVYGLMFMLGILIVQQLPVLPSSSVKYYLASVLTIVVTYYAISAYRGQYRYRKITKIKLYFTLCIKYIFLILFGFIYASWYAELALDNRLDESLTGKNIVVSGRVIGIPMNSGTVQRFEFIVDNFYVDENKNKTVALDEYRKLTRHPEKIRLSWYYGEKINAGEIWQLQIRLKPPHGFMNPGGFDYESWLFQHGIQATG